MAKILSTILRGAGVALFVLVMVAWPVAFLAPAPARAQSPQAPGTPEQSEAPTELKMISHECRNGRVVSLRVAVPVPGVLQIDLDHSVLCKGRGEA